MALSPSELIRLGCGVARVLSDDESSRCPHFNIDIEACGSLSSEGCRHASRQRVLTSDLSSMAAGEEAADSSFIERAAWIPAVPRSGYARGAR